MGGRAWAARHDWTMEGSVYPAAFARHGIAMRTPNAADRALVNDVIFNELCQGRLDATSRAEYTRIIDGLRQEGCDAVALKLRRNSAVRYAQRLPNRHA